MMRRVSLSILAGILSFIVGALLGGWLLYLLSTNQHDRGLEAVMTGTFFFGPIAAFIGFGVTFSLLRRRADRTSGINQSAR